MATKTPREAPWAGQGAVFLCAVLWSTSGLFFKLVNWHPVVISGLRSLIAALFMFGVRLFLTPRGGPKSKKYPLWAGAFCYAFTMLSFVIANKNTTAANAIILQYSAPVWAAILGWLLIKEKPHWEHWAALVCVFGGLFLFFKDGIGSGAFFGDSIALLSGVLFGAHTVYLRMQKEGSPADSMLLAHVINFTYAIPFIILYPPVFTPVSAFSIIFMGTIQLGCASLLYSYGIKRVSAVQAMLTATIEPLLNPIWVLLVIGEMPSVSALFGGGIILAAVVISSVIGRYRDK